MQDHRPSGASCGNVYMESCFSVVPGTIPFDYNTEYSEQHRQKPTKYSCAMQSFKMGLCHLHRTARLSNSSARSFSVYERHTSTAIL